MHCNSIYDGKDSKNVLIQRLKISGSWILTPFVIDEQGYGDYTWAEAAFQPWCSGSGTWEDPYIIENVTINGGGSCLEIQNSKVYFIIQNCTFKNSNSGTGGGINLWHTNNGTLLDNNCSNNRVGIRVASESYNNTISNNIMQNNNNPGIYLDNHCNDNLIFNNTIKDSGVGILLNSYCQNNDIIENRLINNTGDPIAYEVGIWIAVSDSNKIMKNFVRGTGDFGCYLDGSNHNMILNNTFFLNGVEGLFFEGSSYNNVSKNSIANNSVNGIRLYSGSSNNIFWENKIMNNAQRGLYLRRYSLQTGYCENNLFYNNTFYNNNQNAYDESAGPYSYSPLNYWNNTNIGNYWDDYNSIDLNDDGIGDTPYDIPGDSREKDYLPIWKDGPDITIVKPIYNSYFGTTPPQFEISINQAIVNSSWYTLDNGQTNITFTGVSGIIDQTEWDKKLNGSVFIRFYINDSLGEIGYADIIVQKDIMKPTIIINTPVRDTFFSNTAPNFDISIIEPNLNNTWYTLDNGLTNITFIGTSATIDQTEWNKCLDGTIILKFYANDTFGFVNYSEISLIKDATIPVISINQPTDNQIFGNSPPDFNLSIIETNLNITWYTLDNGITEILFSGLVGTIQQTEWDKYSDGLITIRFYVRDKAGNENYAEITVIKETQTPTEAIPGYNLQLLVGFIWITIIIVMRKKQK